MSKYIFLSYARLDRDKDRFNTVRKFYNALVEDVRRKYIDKPMQDICFFDGQDIEPGDDWPNSLSGALSTCNLFVCLYSLTYFSREHCGKEWEIFHSRLLDHARESGHVAAVPPLIFPVLLDPPEGFSIPGKVSGIQFQHDDFPKTYNEEGLHYLIRHKLYKDYNSFVYTFARKLVEAAKRYPLKPLGQVPDISTIKSAFVEQPSQSVFGHQSIEEEDPRRVQFFFVAGKRHEFEGIKDEVACYGNEGGSDWKPYLPACTEEIALIAQGVAYDEKLISEIIVPDDNIIQQLKDAKENKRIVALIVDAWTMQLEKYAEWIQAYDTYDAFNCAMLISSNSADKDTLSKYEILDRRIGELFETKTLRKELGLFFYPISSTEKFREKLAYVMGKIRMDFLSKKVAAQKVTKDLTIGFPTINGPGGS